MGWVTEWVELGAYVSENHKSSNRIELSQLSCDLFNCRGITRIHRSLSRPRPSMRPTATLINIHEHLI